MVATGNPDEYSADIPVLGNDVDIQYYIVAKDVASNTDYHPYDAPSGFHTFHAQARGRIEGSVDLTNSEDNSGVSVTLSGLQVDTTLSVTDGSYFFSGLNNGEYAVKVHKNGYTTQDSIISPITVSQDTISNVDFTLEPIVSALGKNGSLTLPEKYALQQNYPNPFNPQTTIRYQLPNESMVELSLFNSLGQKIRTLVKKHQNAGYYSIAFQADGLSSGIYFYHLKAGKFAAVGKMILMK